MLYLYINYFFNNLIRCWNVWHHSCLNNVYPCDEGFISGDQIRALVPSRDISDDQIVSNLKLFTFLQAQGMARGCTCIRRTRDSAGWRKNFWHSRFEFELTTKAAKNDTWKYHEKFRKNKLRVFIHPDNGSGFSRKHAFDSRRDDKFNGCKNWPQREFH